MTVQPASNPRPRRAFLNHSNPPIGKRFNRLTIIGFAGRQNGRPLWRCKCDCGRETTVHSSNVVGGKTSQCRWCGWDATRKHALGRPLVNTARDEAFARLFASGVSITSIAVLHGVERGTVSGAIDRLRKKGVQVVRENA